MYVAALYLTFAQPISHFKLFPLICFLFQVLISELVKTVMDAKERNPVKLAQIPKKLVGS